MAAIDLGGGSVQEAFALTEAQAKAAPDPLYVTKLKGGGKQYSVYVHRSVPTCMNYDQQDRANDHNQGDFKSQQGSQMKGT